MDYRKYPMFPAMVTSGFMIFFEVAYAIKSRTRQCFRLELTGRDLICLICL